MNEAIRPAFVTILDEANTINCPTKAEMANNTSALAEALYEGNLDAAEIIRKLVWASAIVDQFTEYKKLLASAAPTACESYADEMNGQTLAKYGATITIKKGKPAYDFSEDAGWSEADAKVNDLDAQLKKAKKQRTAIEGVLKESDDANKYIMYYDAPTASVTIND